MKPLLTIFCLVYTLHAFAQNASELYEKGADYYYNIKDPTDARCDSAIVIFRKIIADPTVEEGYKKLSSVNLANIFEAKKEYTKTLYYLKLSDTYIFSFGVCGLSASMQQFENDMMYSRCYQALGKIDSAIAWALSAGSYIYEDDRMVRLKELLLLKYSKQYINNELKKSIAKIKIEKDTDHYSVILPLFGHELILGFYTKNYNATIINMGDKAIIALCRKNWMESKSYHILLGS